MPGVYVGLEPYHQTIKQCLLSSCSNMVTFHKGKKTICMMQIWLDMISGPQTSDSFLDLLLGDLRLGV